MKKNGQFLGLMLIFFIVLSCNHTSVDNRTNKKNSDSIQLAGLLHNMLKYHNSRSKIIDFEIIVKDSFQIGLDTNHLKNTLSDLKSSGYFSEHFLKNYENIGRYVDKKLKNGKYYNEINFPFQDSDPWTFFQDDAGEYWNNFKISDLIINKDLATLQWYLNPQEKYKVNFKKENDSWKVFYLEGFDYDKMLKEQ